MEPRFTFDQVASVSRERRCRKLWTVAVMLKALRVRLAEK
jgi:hypothetical protein